MNAHWYVRFYGVTRGPYTWTQLQDFAEAGHLPEGSEVRRTDRPEWYHARAVPGLFRGTPGATLFPTPTERAEEYSLRPPAAAHVPSGGHPHVMATPGRPLTAAHPHAPVHPQSAAHAQTPVMPPAAPPDGISPRLIVGIAAASILVVAVLLSAAILIKVIDSVVAPTLAAKAAAGSAAPTTVPGTAAQPGGATTASTGLASGPTFAPPRTDGAGGASGDGFPPDSGSTGSGAPSGIRVGPGGRVARVDRVPVGPELTDEALTARARPSIAVLGGLSHTSGGFLVGPRLLVTTRRAIESTDLGALEARFPGADERDRGPYRTRLLWEHPEQDLAFLEIDTRLPALPLTADYRFRPGRDVSLLDVADRPQADADAGRLTHGTAHARALIDGQEFDHIALRAAGGLYGSPLLDRTGAVVGVIAGSARRDDGITYAVAQEDLAEALDQLPRRTEAQFVAAAPLHEAEAVGRKARMLAAGPILAMAAVLKMDVKKVAADLPGVGEPSLKDPARLSRLRLEPFGPSRRPGRESGGIASGAGPDPVPLEDRTVQVDGSFSGHWHDRGPGGLTSNGRIMISGDLLAEMREGHKALADEEELPADVAEHLTALVTFAEELVEAGKIAIDRERFQTTKAEYQAVHGRFFDSLKAHRRP